MTQQEQAAQQQVIAARMQKAATIGLIQSLNNRGYSDAQIKNAAAAYPGLLARRAANRHAAVCQQTYKAVMARCGN